MPKLVSAGHFEPFSRRLSGVAAVAVALLAQVALCLPIEDDISNGMQTSPRYLQEVASYRPVMDTFFSGACQNYSKAGISLRDGVTVSDALGVIYVPNLKAGSLAIPNYMRHYGTIRKLSKINDLKTILRLAEKYKFFTFVREPLSRLRSAYSETLYHTLSKPEKNSAKFLKEPIKDGKQFRMFVKEFVCCRKRFIKEIYHADPQAVFIGSGGPVHAGKAKGAPPYSFIGRMENFQADWEHFLIEVLGIAREKVQTTSVFHSSQSLSWGGKADKGKKKRLAIKAKASQAPLDDEFIQKQACQIYAKEYECYGYPLPPACRSEQPQQSGHFEFEDQVYAELGGQTEVVDALGTAAAVTAQERAKELAGVGTEVVASTAIDDAEPAEVEQTTGVQDIGLLMDLI